jgi:DNA polymerase-4
MGTILHLNTVGLMAAIEEGLDPAARGRPFVVAGEGRARAVVLDVSTAAHREGLRRGMPLALARSLIPGLTIRAPRPELYEGAEERLWRLALEYTPLVERAGPGHLFVDLSGTGRLHGAAPDAALRLRSRILADTGLRPALALSSTKTASKVATRVFRPGGFVALSDGDEGPLVRLQPAALLPGVGPALLGRLSLLGIDDIGGVADLSELEARAIGSRGPELVARARCVDDSPVDPGPPERLSASGEAVFEPDTIDPEVLRLRLAALASDLAFSVRKAGRGFRRAEILLTYTDGLGGSGSSSSRRALSRDDEALGLALAALEQARGRRVRVRRLRLVLSGFQPAGPELELFEPEDLRRARLQSALDSIRARYGGEALRPCAMMALA